MENMLLEDMDYEKINSSPPVDGMTPSGEVTVIKIVDENKEIQKKLSDPNDEINKKVNEFFGVIKDKNVMKIAGLMNDFGSLFEKTKENDTPKEKPRRKVCGFNTRSPEIPKEEKSESKIEIPVISPTETAAEINQEKETPKVEIKETPEEKFPFHKNNIITDIIDLVNSFNPTLNTIAPLIPLIKPFLIGASNIGLASMFSPNSPDTTKLVISAVNCPNRIIHIENSCFIMTCDNKRIIKANIENNKDVAKFCSLVEDSISETGLTFSIGTLIRKENQSSKETRKFINHLLSLYKLKA